MHKGNRYPLPFASATTSTLPTASRTSASQPTSLGFFSKEAYWRIGNIFQHNPVASILAHTRTEAEAELTGSICGAPAEPALVGTCSCTPLQGPVGKQCCTQGPEQRCGKRLLCPGTQRQEEGMKDWKKAHFLYKNTP